MGYEGRANNICTKLDRLDEVPCRNMKKALVIKVWCSTSHSKCIIHDKGDAVIMGNLCNVSLYPMINEG